MWLRGVNTLSLAAALTLTASARSQEPGQMSSEVAKASFSLGSPIPPSVVQPPDKPFPGILEFAPAVNMSDRESARVAPRISVRADVGDGVGFTRGFTYVEGFLPIVQSAGKMLIFVDARGVNFDDAKRWEWNAGIGLRWLAPRSDWVFGVNSFFDWRDTGPSIFRQVGLGLEASGPILDLRSNLYFPIGSYRNKVQDTGFANPRFIGSNILLDRVRTFENAMRGFDLEAGVPVPYMQRLGLRAYGGCYHYENTGAPTIDGVRGRLESQINDYVTAHLSIQNDGVFDTTVSGGLALHWGGRRPLGARTASDRLGQRVVRDPNIVVTRTTDTATETALDPTTGQPIIVRHANSNAAPGGDGSFERPYQTLPQLQDGSSAGQILFVHANSVFTGQAIKLQNNQRFLGDGILHSFVAKQGTFFLPRTSGTAPILIAPRGDVTVSLADNNEVSGFTFDQFDGYAIRGTDIANFNINRNAFNNNNGVLLPAISLLESRGTGAIVSNTFEDVSAFALSTGFEITNLGGAALRVAIIDNSTFNVFIGGLIHAEGASQVFATLRRNQFIDLTHGNGVFASGATRGGTVGLQLLNNQNTRGYILAQESNGTFLVEDTRSTNVGPFMEAGAIITVPVGTLGFGGP